MPQKRSTLQADESKYLEGVAKMSEMGTKLKKLQEEVAAMQPQLMDAQAEASHLMLLIQQVGVGGVASVGWASYQCSAEQSLGVDILEKEQGVTANPYYLTHLANTPPSFVATYTKSWRLSRALLSSLRRRRRPLSLLLWYLPPT